MSTGRTGRLPRRIAQELRTTSAPEFKIGDVTPRPELRIGQYWTPGLLDRLQVPLTRYHD